MTRSGLSRGGAVLLCVALLASACGDDTDAAEGAADQTVTTTAAGEAAVSAAPCSDESGDLTDDKGNPVDGQGLDLTDASLEFGDGTATVSWTQDGGFPAEDGSDPTGASRPLLWALYGSTPDGTPLDVVVQYAEGEGYRAGSMSAVDPALGGEGGTVSVTGDGGAAVLSVEIPMDGSLPSGTTYAFVTEYYPADGNGLRVDDRCPTDFGEELEITGG